MSLRSLILSPLIKLCLVLFCMSKIIHAILNSDEVYPIILLTQTVNSDFFVNAILIFEEMGRKIFVFLKQI